MFPPAHSGGVLDADVFPFSFAERIPGDEENKPASPGENHSGVVAGLAVRVAQVTNRQSDGKILPVPGGSAGHRKEGEKGQRVPRVNGGGGHKHKPVGESGSSGKAPPLEASFGIKHGKDAKQNALEEKSDDFRRVAGAAEQPGAPKEHVAHQDEELVDARIELEGAGIKVHRGFEVCRNEWSEKWEPDENAGRGGDPPPPPPDHGEKPGEQKKRVELNPDGEAESSHSQPAATSREGEAAKNKQPCRRCL